MKKLLGLLAVAPMAIAACGGSTDTAAKADHTAYYVGHGVNFSGVANGVAGKQNDAYAVIETMVFDNDGTLSYNIEESNGGLVVDPTLTGDALAVPTWTAQTETNIETAWEASSDYDTAVIAHATAASLPTDTEADITAAEADYLANGTYAADKDAWASTATNWITGAEVTAAGWNDTVVADGYYINTGESLRYVYDVVSVDFDRAKDMLVDSAGDDKEFINKDESYGNNDSFYWMSNKKSWENYLSRVYNTCALVDAVDAADITAYASFKGDEPGNVAGATAGETGLYIAAAITSAQDYCAE